MNPNRLMYGNVCVTCEINYCNWARDLFVGDREACYTKKPQPLLCQCDSFISKHFLELKWMGDNNILSLRFLMMWQSWIPTITTLQVWLHLLCLPLQRVHVAVRCLWTTRSPRSNKLKKLDMCHRCPPTKMSWTLQDVVKAGLWLKYYHVFKERLMKFAAPYLKRW